MATKYFIFYIANFDNYIFHFDLANFPFPIWPNGWVFVYELSGSGFESSCSHLNFRLRACIEQGVPWHSCNYRVWIYAETRTWHDKKIQSTTYIWEYSNVLQITANFVCEPKILRTVAKIWTLQWRKQIHGNRFLNIIT